MLLKTSRMVHKMENAGRDIKFEEFKSIRIAYMRRIGEYGVGNKELMERLKSHLRERNLLTPDSILLGIALDDPGSVDKDSLRYDVGMVVEEDGSIDLDIREIPDGLYAVFEIAHTAGSVSEFWSNLPSLCGGLSVDSSRPIIERYDARKVASHLCEFCIPVLES